MWLGKDEAPAWLDVDRGLSLAGFDGTPSGRRTFDEFVNCRAAGLADETLSGRDERAVRSHLRAQTGLPVEVASAVLPGNGEGPTERSVRYHGPLPVPPRWPGDLDELVKCVAAYRGIPVELLRSRSHQPDVVEARRLTIVTGILLLRRRTIEMAAALGISEASVSQHLRRADPLLNAAREVGARMRGQSWVS